MRKREEILSDMPTNETLKVDNYIHTRLVRENIRAKFAAVVGHVIAYVPWSLNKLLVAAMTFGVSLGNVHAAEESRMMERDRSQGDCIEWSNGTWSIDKAFNTDIDYPGDEELNKVVNTLVRTFEGKILLSSENAESLLSTEIYTYLKCEPNEINARPLITYSFGASSKELKSIRPFGIQFSERNEAKGVRSISIRVRIIVPSVNSCFAVKHLKQKIGEPTSLGITNFQKPMPDAYWQSLPNLLSPDRLTLSVLVNRLGCIGQIEVTRYTKDSR